MSHFVITGSGTPANRLEINDLIKDDKSFSLYIQALGMFQQLFACSFLIEKPSADMSSRTQDDVASFFQVGGIHGLPFIPWDDATGNSLAPNQWGGYCTHGSVLFPTWHRPYVMLYEAIHDGIHVDVGGNGQMSDPSVAAFDPIFFLHHANVDRMVSLWSALHPGVWVTSSDQDDGTFTIPPDGPVDVSTPLTPFWNAQTTFWASAGVTDTSKLGYTYPEFNGLDTTNTTAVQQAIAQAVNRLYGSGSRRASVPRQFLAMPAAAVKEGVKATAATVAPSGSKEGVKEDTATHNIGNSAPVTAAGASLPSGATTRSIGVSSASQPEALLAVHHNTPAPPEGNIWDWSARIEFKKYELGSSFTVLIFLGQVPENPEDWRIAPNCVGAHHAFVNRVPDQCANCQNQLNIVTEGFVHLNEGIAEFSGLESFEPAVIHPYLEKEMHWRVQKTDGSPAQLESLEVTVIATPLSLPPGSAFPVAGEPTRHPRITHGRPGGARQRCVNV
ncbi:hypothetical protein M422DRAFT_48640 [Sphaerobolus stellatus SS14]|uniref:tyrosinase n=1 Tax=Sphaerobolus stellatus (strain SS14) TaxID=990650 RepID=A0A0C9VSL0_SPHS4|nr:hypothetical protein M422DRAFT_48640 [Sphaerobolus stellatus SS14]